MPVSYKSDKTQPSSGRRKRKTKGRWTADQRLKSAKVFDLSEKDESKIDLRLMDPFETTRQQRVRSDGFKERHTTRQLPEDSSAVRL